MDENPIPKTFAFAIDPPSGPLPLIVEQLIKTRAAIDALAVIVCELHGSEAGTVATRYQELKNEFDLEIAYSIQRNNPPPT